MKNIRYILGVLLLPFLFIACSDDEIGVPNITADEFVQVANRTAKVTHDGTYYILTEYVEGAATEWGITPCVFIVDREEDAAKVKALGDVTDVIFAGTGQKTKYQPTGTDNNKTHYMILLTSIKKK
ncbi:hypothetical protein [Bacteroides timonensis]|uniref:hypothetical protein n=1 Tax=Bacteroides timonensis TaxID=1470345 RepID=UPI0004AC6F59|nr:hypothetical protein [Bacteroides timonensis]